MIIYICFYTYLYTVLRWLRRKGNNNKDFKLRIKIQEISASTKCFDQAAWMLRQVDIKTQEKV